MFSFQKSFYRAFAFLLLLVYSFQLTLKAGIFYYYLKNKDIIAKTLCVNKEKPKSCCKGSCQLNKWLNKTDDSSPSEKDKKVPVIPEVLLSKFQENFEPNAPDLNKIIHFKIILFPSEKNIHPIKGFFSDILKPPIS
jgi:hypothetical protein